MRNLQIQKILIDRNVAGRYMYDVICYVVVKTPLSNIRITTFFAGESEAKIVDPSRISEVQAVGCEVDFALQ